MRRKTNEMNRKDSVPFWLLVSTSCITVIGLFLTVPVRTVEADAALLPGSTPTVTTPTAPISSPTPIKVAVSPAKMAFAKQVIEPSKGPGRILKGFASWYGGSFNGRKTASGETYDMNALTACHPTLPFGTRVKVLNLRTHQSVVVRITDRGILYGRRVIDLSYAAAEKIGMAQSGVAPVTIEVLRPGEMAEN
jgi:rare lipoprotein A